MRGIIDLLKWYLLGALVGFPLGMRLAGCSNELTITQGAVMYTLMLAGLCGLAILTMRRLKLI